LLHGVNHDAKMGEKHGANRASNLEGMLAQLVEQRTFNPFVVGSTPAHPTKISGPECKFRPFFCAEFGRNAIEY
jgi:hypothetical protein